MPSPIDSPGSLDAGRKRLYEALKGFGIDVDEEQLSDYQPPVLTPQLSSVDLSRESRRLVWLLDEMLKMGIFSDFEKEGCVFPSSASMIFEALLSHLSGVIDLLEKLLFSPDDALREKVRGCLRVFRESQKIFEDALRESGKNLNQRGGELAEALGLVRMKSEFLKGVIDGLS
jgi:hypothetical protein